MYQSHHVPLKSCTCITEQNLKFFSKECKAVADLHSKIMDVRPPPGVQILSISCSFWGILAKSYVGAPPGELAPPPQGNPRSATAKGL